MSRRGSDARPNNRLDQEIDSLEETLGIRFKSAIRDLRQAIARCRARQSFDEATVRREVSALDSRSDDIARAIRALAEKLLRDPP